MKLSPSIVTTVPPAAGPPLGVIFEIMSDKISLFTVNVLLGTDAAEKLTRFPIGVNERFAFEQPDK